MATTAEPALSHSDSLPTAASRINPHPIPGSAPHRTCTFVVQVSEHSSVLVDVVLDRTIDGTFYLNNAPEQIAQALSETWRQKLIAKSFSMYVLGIARVNNVCINVPCQDRYDFN